MTMHSQTSVPAGLFPFPSERRSMKSINRQLPLLLWFWFPMRLAPWHVDQLKGILKLSDLWHKNTHPCGTLRCPYCEWAWWTTIPRSLQKSKNEFSHIKPVQENTAFVDTVHSYSRPLGLQLMFAGCFARQTEHCCAGAGIKVPKQIRDRKWWHGPLGRIRLLRKWVRQQSFHLRGEWGRVGVVGSSKTRGVNSTLQRGRLHWLYRIRHGNVVSIFFSLQHQSLLKPFKQRWNNSLFVLCGLSTARRDCGRVLRTCRIHFAVLLPHPSLMVETIYPLSVNSISGESANHYKISLCFPTLIILKDRILYAPHLCEFNLSSTI